MESNSATNIWNSDQGQQPILNDYQGQRYHCNSDISHAAVDNFDTNKENNYNSGNLPNGSSNQWDIEDEDVDFGEIFNSPEKKSNY
jgi:hypothetical protein